MPFIRRHPGLTQATLILGLAVIAAIVVVVAQGGAPPAVAARSGERFVQRAWASCSRHARSGGPSTFHPLSDHAAARLVAHQPETRTDNSRPYSIAGVAYPAPNDDVPTSAQVAAFHRAKTQDGRSVLAFDPYFRYVDGRDGLRHPSTDDLIQWGAHKWGIPEDWLRAEYDHESYWNVYYLGDRAFVPTTWYRRYPPQARVGGSHEVYQSLGLTQEKWLPDGSIGAGTEPLRWRSTAFNIDYQAATVRMYYDNPDGARSAWGDKSYVPCQQWNSIGGWFRPYPWGNGDQQQYVGAVKQLLANRDWTSSDFLSFSPSSLPPGVRLH